MEVGSPWAGCTLGDSFRFPKRAILWGPSVACTASTEHGYGSIVIQRAWLPCVAGTRRFPILRANLAASTGQRAWFEVRLLGGCTFGCSWTTPPCWKPEGTSSSKLERLVRETNKEKTV